MAETGPGGKTCARCQKVVLDLKGKTDREIRAAFSHGRGTVCARIETSRLGVLLPSERPAGVSPLAAAVLTGLALTCVDPPPAAAASPAAIQVPSSPSDEAEEMGQVRSEEWDKPLQPPWIQGQVLDLQQGIALPGANVVVMGEPIRTVTDPEGRYRLDLGPIWEQREEITLEVTFEGYVPMRVVVDRARSEQAVVGLDWGEAVETIVVGEVFSSEVPRYKLAWWRVKGWLSRHR